MLRKIEALVTAGLVLYVAFLSTGCLAAQKYVQVYPRQPQQSKESPTGRMFRILDTTVLKPGTKIEVTLSGGKPLEGKFEGIKTAANSEYAPRFEAWRARLENRPAVPDLGSRIMAVDNRANSFAGEFAGFDRGCLLVRRTGETTLRDLNLNVMAGLRGPDKSAIDLDLLAGEFAASRVPFRSAIRFKGPGGISELATEKIEKIRVMPPRALSALSVAAIIVSGLILVSIASKRSPGWADTRFFSYITPH